MKFCEVSRNSIPNKVLKVSAFYLEKQKSFIPKKKNLFGRTAKVDPKDGVSCPNFQWRFWRQPPIPFHIKYPDPDPQIFNLKLATLKKFGNSELVNCFKDGTKEKIPFEIKLSIFKAPTWLWTWWSATWSRFQKVRR